MHGDILRLDLKQLGNLGLRQPQAFMLQPDIQLHLAVVGTVDAVIPLRPAPRLVQLPNSSKALRKATGISRNQR